MSYLHRKDPALWNSDKVPMSRPDAWLFAVGLNENLVYTSQ